MFRLPGPSQARPDPPTEGPVVDRLLPPTDPNPDVVMIARVAVCDPTQALAPDPDGREGGSPGADERRGAARHPCRVPSVCHPLPLSRERDSWWAVAQDISASGIGLVLERR